MEGPYIRIEEAGRRSRCGGCNDDRARPAVDVHLGDPSVSRLHAEIIRRGPYVYVTDLGLSRNGTRVNGRLVARRRARGRRRADVRLGPLPGGRLIDRGTRRRDGAAQVGRARADPAGARRGDLAVPPALSDEAFVAPATAREIAADLVVTEAAVKQHLLRLYQKFRIPEGANRRVRLANEVVALGMVRPLPPAERSALAEVATPPSATPAPVPLHSVPPQAGPPPAAPVMSPSAAPAVRPNRPRDSRVPNLSGPRS